LVKTEEPNGNVADMLPFPFSLADAIGPATSPASAITKLVITTVKTTKILRMLKTPFN
jgi:hypothetical protein